MRREGQFLKAVRGRRGSERFPEAREADKSLRTGIRLVLVRADEEIDAKELDKRTETRLRHLLKLAENTAIDAPQELEEDEIDDLDSAESNSNHDMPGFTPISDEP